MRLSDGEQQRMEQRLALRFAAIGDGAQSWLERQLSALSPDCALLTRWCYSASHVSIVPVHQGYEIFIECEDLRVLRGIIW